MTDNEDERREFSSVEEELEYWKDKAMEYRQKLVFILTVLTVFFECGLYIYVCMIVRAYVPVCVFAMCANV